MMMINFTVYKLNFTFNSVQTTIYTSTHVVADTVL